MFLIYGGEEELVAKCYVGADPDDSKSQSGHVFVMNGGAVSWRGSKQQRRNMLLLQKQCMKRFE
jgi:hypothetical protein